MFRMKKLNPRKGPQFAEDSEQDLLVPPHTPPQSCKQHGMVLYVSFLKTQVTNKKKKSQINGNPKPRQLHTKIDKHINTLSFPLSEGCSVIKRIYLIIYIPITLKEWAIFIWFPNTGNHAALNDQGTPRCGSLGPGCLDPQRGIGLDSALCSDVRAPSVAAVGKNHRSGSTLALRRDCLWGPATVGNL